MNGSAANDAVALILRDIHKRFGDVIALDGAALQVRRGTVHALLGENGAGKSTLMRIAYGLTPADRGDTRIFGSRPIRSVREAIGAGTGMVHQHLSLVPALSPAENLVLGGRGRMHPQRAVAALQHAESTFGLAVPSGGLVRDLSVVEQQRLEILKALTRGARLLILDEPTAVLAPADARDLLCWLRNFADSGGTAVLVTHKLREALAVSDDITVLRRGRVSLSVGRPGANEAQLARAIFGDEPPAPTVVAPDVAPDRPVVVRADDVDVLDERGAARIRSASFQLRAGDIVGIAAIEGSGHAELLRALAGLQAIARGRLTAPRDIALVPADRLRDALIPDFSLTENVALHGAGGRRGVLRWRDIAGRTGAIIRRFGIVSRSPDQRAGSLSGGNQQRLVLGRELESPKQLIVADNPTRGLDMRATAFVHEALRAAARDGAVVVLHAADVDDILDVATRILVVFHGTVREAPLDRDAVGRAMVGVA